MRFKKVVLPGFILNCSFYTKETKTKDFIREFHELTRSQAAGRESRSLTTDELQMDTDGNLTEANENEGKIG
jgi:hypothetical protein